MAWRVEYTAGAQKALDKLDKTTAERIMKKMDGIAVLEDPRSMGKGLTGGLSGFWRYRVGDYRVICNIDDGSLLILAVKIGHRNKIYK